jgi:nudix-type nucleoside diphosphatase (YffH/AdpP family)
MTAGTPDDSRARIRSTEILAKGWATFKRVTFDVRTGDGGWQTLTREVQDHGNAVAVLPVDAERGTVLLARQFRLAAFLAGHDGMLLEACAGIVDPGESADDAVRREAEEELGYRLHDLAVVYDLFSSPGSLTERMMLFAARYTPADRIARGGGAAHEGEDIEVVEMSLDEALAAVAGGGIVDAKTIILLQHARLAALAG